MRSYRVTQGALNNGSPKFSTVIPGKTAGSTPATIPKLTNVASTPPVLSKPVQSAASKAYTPPVPLNPSHDTGYFSKDYLKQIHKEHLGVDLGAPAGTSVKSPVDGKIVGYYPNKVNSFVVIQQNGTSTQHVLGHVSCDGCKPGQQLSKGQPFGAKVLANPKEGDHVHWGANYKGIPIKEMQSWGWGQAPATSTPAEAAAKGWFDPLGGQ